ncbi:PilT protein domain protein [Caldicellulosiruptor hydrothermalis 108]|uniref:PilT protein domain protein n=1 Tax=Caldicellulosiruptor hydrothermalis (strain DSM 18901 / VKM B-2411 / 108) TaxID=632292 RepID=E4QE03_CALH1|nr:PIN domain nuclease [Caldicellulosiruptor hydrothermalis]ADQ07694.1 PilT protein domain protein [Caldicellulosiruptor hydrothermalis 108]
MILVDTSVLIDFFKGNTNEKVEKFEWILKNKIPFGITHLIYQEILQGAKDEKEFELLKEYLSTQQFYELTKGKKSYEEAALLYFKCKKRGINLRSTVDVIIAQIAIENNLYLLHNDRDYFKIAEVENRLKEY